VNLRSPEPAVGIALARRATAASATARWHNHRAPRTAASAAKFGHNRDGKSGKLQIVFGLLCAKDGCLVAIEVFDGNVADPATLANQVKKLKERFALKRVFWQARCVGCLGSFFSAMVTPCERLRCPA
jgi:hypothetical protein